LQHEIQPPDPRQPVPQKVRLILTIGSFAIALVSSRFSRGEERFSRGEEIAGADRLIVVGRTGLMQLLPISHGDKSWPFPASSRHAQSLFGAIYQDERNFFHSRHRPRNQRKVMTELVVPTTSEQFPERPPGR